MRNTAVLKSGIIGYVYRWLRNAGLVALVSGAYFVGSSAYHARTDGRVEAVVTGLEIDCALVGDSFFTRAFSKDVECGEADALRAVNGHTPLAIHETMVARLAYQSEIGADYTARLSIEALGRPDLQRGDTVTILYNRGNPDEVRGVTDAARYKGLGLLCAGLAMLALVWIARRAANYENNVVAEVAALEQKFLKAAARPAPASLGGRRQVPGKRRP